MIEIDKRLHQEIKEYCKFNGLIMKDFVNKLLKKAFMVEKYGDKPFALPTQVNQVDFFELLEEEKNDNTRISITANNENGEQVNETQTPDTLSSTEEKEEIKVVRTRKRKLS